MSLSLSWVPRRLRERDMFLLYAIVILYALFFQMQNPAQMSLIKSLVSGEEAKAQFAWVRSANGVAQLGGSLLSGVLVDKIGAKGVMLLSVVASVVSYALVATATDVSHLYWAQVPTVLQHGVLAARAYVSIKLDDSERAEYLGYVGFAYGIGFVIGPALGGWLSTISLQLAATCAAVGSLLSIVLVLMFRSDGAPTVRPNAAGEDADVQRVKQTLWEGYKRIFHHKTLFWALFVKALFSFAMALFHGTFQLIADDRFGMNPAQTGTLLSYVGVIGMITQAVLVKMATARFSDDKITMFTSFALAAAFCGYAVIHDATSLFLLCVPMVSFTTIFNLINTAQIARMAPDDLKGTLVAVDMALFSGMRIWVPAFGAHILATFGYWSLGGSSAAAMIIIAIFLIYFQRPGALKLEATHHQHKD